MEDKEEEKVEIMATQPLLSLGQATVVSLMADLAKTINLSPKSKVEAESFKRKPVAHFWQAGRQTPDFEIYRI